MENESVKLLWDLTLECDNVIEARRPDIVTIQKEDEPLFDHRYNGTREHKGS